MSTVFKSIDLLPHWTVERTLEVLNALPSDYGIFLVEGRLIILPTSEKIDICDIEFDGKTPVNNGIWPGQVYAEIDPQTPLNVKQLIAADYCNCIWVEEYKRDEVKDLVHEVYKSHGDKIYSLLMERMNALETPTTAGQCVVEIGDLPTFLSVLDAVRNGAMHKKLQSGTMPRMGKVLKINATGMEVTIAHLCLAGNEYIQSLDTSGLCVISEEEYFEVLLNGTSM